MTASSRLASEARAPPPVNHPKIPAPRSGRQRLAHRDRSQFYPTTHWPPRRRVRFTEPRLGSSISAASPPKWHRRPACDPTHRDAPSLTQNSAAAPTAGISPRLRHAPAHCSSFVTASHPTSARLQIVILISSFVISASASRRDNSQYPVGKRGTSAATGKSTPKSPRPGAGASASHIATVSSFTRRRVVPPRRRVRSL